MTEIIYENMLNFDMFQKDLTGMDLLLSKVNPKTDFEQVVKLYFDLDNADEKIIQIETEAYVKEEAVSNKDYLLFSPNRAGAFCGVTTNYIHYFLGSEEKTDDNKQIYYKPLKLNKFALLNYFDKKVFSKYLLQKLLSFYSYGLDKKPIMNFVYYNNVMYVNDFYNEFKNKNIFTIGFIKNRKKYLLCKSRKYIEFHIKQIETATVIDDNKAKKGICDFCKKESSLINEFGKGNYILKNLKTFTSTAPQVFYSYDKNNLEKTIRCCNNCFGIISQADTKLNDFYLGCLREKRIGKSDKIKNYSVFGFIDSVVQENINFNDIKYALEYFFGKTNALDTIKKLPTNDDIFNDDWNIIINIFIAEKTDKTNKIILNIRNINPQLFKKYNEIFIFIDKLYANMLGWEKFRSNFAFIFETISLLDIKVTFDFFESFLNQKDIDAKIFIKKSLPFIKRRFLANTDNKNYEHLLLGLTSILIIDNLRTQEEVMEFNIDDFIDVQEIENDDKNKTTIYTKKDSERIAKSLGFKWDKLYVALFDLGNIIQETKSEIRHTKDTDIEKVFMKKINFSGMRKDDICNYVSFLERKFQDYKNFIYHIDDKRERLTKLNILLNQSEKHDSQKATYLIAFGYEFSQTISNYIGRTINAEKKQTKDNK